MLLQVHDELVFEAPPEEIDQVKATREDRDGRRLQARRPAAAEVGVGDNWRDAK